MKRFFQPVGSNGSSKKRAIDEEVGHASAVVAAEVREEKGPEGEPAKFLTWNANSFLLRLKNNREEFYDLLRRVDPDVIALQEVRMPAAGKKGQPKDQSNLKDDTTAAREEKQTILRALSVAPLSKYQVWWSLAESKYSGTALLVKDCFKPVSVRFSIDAVASRGTHEVNGRIILAEFKTFRLLVTYVPNNGWKEEENSFPRRRQWDKKMHAFVSEPSKKPLIWCGDLNVSHQDIDVSHPEFFQNAKMNGYVPPNKEDAGQPGFTMAERQRFSKFLEDGNLVDAYRWIHKTQDMDNGFTWSGNPIGKYSGKRMRIDYFLISQQLLPRLLRCDIHGCGVELQGFCGSDHCPLTLELSPQNSTDRLISQVTDEMAA